MYVLSRGDFGVGLVFAIGALVFWGSWSGTMGLTSKQMRFEHYYFDFAASILVTGVVGSFIGGSIPGEMSDTPFLTELWSYKEDCYFFSLLGGIIWNMACTLLGKGISMMGQAIGFPLCTGTGLISGSLIAYIIAPGHTKVQFLVLGNFLALCGICTAGYVAHLKEQETVTSAVDVEIESNESMSLQSESRESMDEFK